MVKSKVAGFVVAGIVLICVVFAVVLLLIKALWAWTIPDLFPGAVRDGLVAGSISWATAAKLALFVAVLSGVARGGSGGSGERSTTVCIGGSGPAETRA